jgi:phospholipid/cholesterol/gamma-HCH transport system substrate-binding protein
VNKQAPSTLRILSMVAFAASCIGLLLFLWISFGGTIPFAAQGYRFSVEFNQAIELSPQSDVRIAGVSVGKVESVNLDTKTGLSRAVIQIDSQYSPRPANTRAILRAKSLLGETYVELSPGSENGPKIPDGGSLPEAQVAPTVQLDQVLSTFDPATRQAFEVWQEQDGIALTNRGEDFNAALSQLYPFATNVESVLTVLRHDSAATTALLHDTGQVFSAISRSPSALQGFIRNSNSVFAATAAQDTALANSIKAFPNFLIATRQTIARLNTFAANAKPLVDELRPAAVQLSPALEETAVVAPELRAVLTDIGPVTAASRTGIPAFDRFLNASIPWLGRLTPYLGNLVPIFNYINVYRREIAAFFANSAATTQGTQLNVESTAEVHYLRISNPVNPEVLTNYQHRLESNRANPYTLPNGYSELTSGLSVFDHSVCTSNAQPTIGSSIPSSLAAILRNTYYTATPGGPPCKAQGSLGSATTGQDQAFPHLQPLP